MYCNEVPTKFIQCVFDNDDKLAPKELDYLNKCLFFPLSCLSLLPVNHLCYIYAVDEWHSLSIWFSLSQ